MLTSFCIAKGADGMMRSRYPSYYYPVQSPVVTQQFLNQPFDGHQFRRFNDPATLRDPQGIFPAILSALKGPPGLIIIIIIININNELNIYFMD